MIVKCESMVCSLHCKHNDKQCFSSLGKNLRDRRCWGTSNVEELEWLLGYAWFLGEAIRDQAAILIFKPGLIFKPCLSFLNIPIKFLVQISGSVL